MNAIVPAAGLGAVPAKLANQPIANSELSAGIEGSFGILGYKGKVWSIRYRGEERILLREDGDGPRNSVEVIILKGSANKSKIWYENGYVEGSTAAPDCFSTNGVTPDAGAQKKQATACVSCPKNAWGSRITPAGKQGKACQDSKRVSIVPLGDPRNEVFGGPMLLRVPAASLQALATYADTLAKMGYNYYAIATRISFDPAESYPKFVFSGIRVLTEAEADAVIELRDTAQVTRILAEGTENAAPAQIQAQPQQFFEQPPAQPVLQPQVQVAPQAPVQPAVQPQPAVAPVAQPVQSNGFGAAAPVAQPVAQPVPTAAVQMVTPPVTAAAPAPVDNGGAAGASFDAKLDSLLG